MKAWEFSETVEGVLVEGSQSLDGVGWVAGGQVLAPAEAAYSPLPIAFFGRAEKSVIKRLAW